VAGRYSLLARAPIAACLLGRLSHSQGELMSRRVASGGFDDHPPATRSIYAPRDSILLSGSHVAPDHHLEPLQVPKSLRDIALFIGTLIFIAGFGVGFYASVFVLLLSNTR
jgi:hypothetical protein